MRLLNISNNKKSNQLSRLKKETGDRRQETGGKLHGDSNPK
ncbi:MULTISPECIES: hypothetical protein [Okeania]|nr:hypothetical protein [Okeania sp. SIO2B9]